MVYVRIETNVHVDKRMYMHSNKSSFCTSCAVHPLMTSAASALLGFLQTVNSLSGSLLPHMSVSYFTVTDMGFLRAVNSLNGSLFPHMLVSYFTVTCMGFLQAVNSLNGSLFPHMSVSYFTVTCMGFLQAVNIPQWIPLSSHSYSSELF